MDIMRFSFSDDEKEKWRLLRPGRAFMDKNDILLVTTFGGFSMTWNGRNLTGGSKSSDTQLVRLMQILLHYKDEGVDRAQLMELLDEDSNAADVHHLLRSVIYNARNRLKAAGLPGDSFIEFRNGKYYWTDKIPVFEDSRHFEEMCSMAKNETDSVRRGALYRDACFLYQGDFLPHQTRLIWVSEEERRYSQLFKMCVEAAADMLRVLHDYSGLEALGRHASRVSQYNEWEALTMEALIALGRHRDAQVLYEKTVESYQKDLGLKLSSSMNSRLEALLTGMGKRSYPHEDIRQDLDDNVNGKGGLYCTYPVFRGIYRMIRRSAERTGKSAFLITCTLVCDRPSGDDTEQVSDETFYRISERLRTVICNSVRQSDAFCRFAHDQYLIILTNRDKDDCGAVCDRIDRGLRTGGSNIRVEYEISPVRNV